MGQKATTATPRSLASLDHRRMCSPPSASFASQAVQVASWTASQHTDGLMTRSGTMRGSLSSTLSKA